VPLEGVVTTAVDSFPSPAVAAVQLQSDEEGTPATETAPETTTVTATATSGLAAATTPARSTTAPTDADVDKWTRALYPSLHRRLRQELLLDRERLGYSTDIRY
jgi:hypothetical protein